jgi:hypothetical protein
MRVLLADFDDLQQGREQLQPWWPRRRKNGNVVDLPRGGQLLHAADRTVAWLEQFLDPQRRRPVAAMQVASTFSFPPARVG